MNYLYNTISKASLSKFREDNRNFLHDIHNAYKTVGLKSCRITELSDHRAIGLEVGSPWKHALTSLHFQSSRNTLRWKLFVFVIYIIKYEFRKIVQFPLYRKCFKHRTTRKGHRWNSHDLYESSFCWTCTTDTYSRTNHKNKANKNQLVDNFYFTPITGDTPPCLRGQATWNEVIPGFLSLPPSASALVWVLRVMYDCIIPVADRRLSGDGNDAPTWAAWRCCVPPRTGRWMGFYGCEVLALAALVRHHLFRLVFTCWIRSGAYWA